MRYNCTLGVKNACSKLYGACIRIAKSMGYKKVITYTLASETGSSVGDWEYLTDCFIVNDDIDIKLQLDRTVKSYCYNLLDEFPVLLIWIKK